MNVFLSNNDHLYLSIHLKGKTNLDSTINLLKDLLDFYFDFDYYAIANSGKIIEQGNNLNA